MDERLTFAERAHLSVEEVATIARCLGALLPSIGSLGCPVPELLAASRSSLPVALGREPCLDLCAGLLLAASRARRAGEDVAAFALEGIEALLLDALVEGRDR